MTRTYVTPRALCRGEVARRLLAAGEAWPMSGGDAAFTAVEVTKLDGTALASQVLTRMRAGPLVLPVAIAQQRLPFAGIALDRPRIMGIVNVTPDSFSDGGRHPTTEAAIVHAIALAEAGADIVDIGGESTRPGAVPVTPDEEQRRVLPVIADLAGRGLKVSIDTRHTATMAAALSAGATIVNDVTALADHGAIDVVAASEASVVLMHMQGDPRTMQANPTYVWAPGDIFDVLARRRQTCLDAGIDGARIALDPGIGFGQNDNHIAQVLDHLAMFHGLGGALLVGASRKGFIGRMSADAGPSDRLAGSLAIAVHAVRQGVHIVRVHDVRETRQAIAIAQKLQA